ncbi:hypothetical protein CERSUDRAFT_98376 [Gelatoporia subvermispora B]|uniref:Heterokaryon incompatibility domain-containing protein n=1 Tax=Ceriporiopsis subvermispora (strain B) TaxID=914234 RepID=M2R4J4_CERS8|nr:hypothetical protein CERSUDRAFT_98376 [Gelatoporia subvermispora B]
MKILGLRSQRLLKERKEVIDEIKRHIRLQYTEGSPEREELQLQPFTGAALTSDISQDQEAPTIQSTFTPYVMSHDHGDLDHDAEMVAKQIIYFGSQIAEKRSEMTDDNFGIFDTVWLGGKHDGFPLGTFVEYWNLRLRDAGFTPCPHEMHGLHSTNGEFASIAQCHFTYGITEAVAGIRIPENFLLRRTPSGEVVMAFDNFGGILHYLSHYNAERDSKTLRRWYRRAHAELTTAGPDQFCLSLCLSTSQTSQKATHVPHVHGHSGKYAEVYEKRLLEDGWCPFTIHMLFDAGIIPLAYAYRCGPLIEGDISHRQCTSYKCRRNTIDESTYLNRHVMDACKCEYWKPTSENVIRIISDGDVPIIRVLEASEDQSLHHLLQDTMYLSVGAHSDTGYLGQANEPGFIGNKAGGRKPIVSCDKSSGIPYVAISHVWADGLGSTTEDGLPSCQVQELAMMARHLVPDSGAFWIDSLCVPRDKPSRKRAIGRMAEIYREADAVLVIDSGIQKCSLQTPYTEIKLRIVTSGWMQRVWTLQEACLARKLYFKLSDGYVNIKDIPGHSTNPADVHLSELLDRMLAPAHKEASDECHCSINDITHRLTWRNIGKPEDETLAIAALLQVDAKDLVNLPAERRMAELLLKVKNMHSTVAFRQGPKLKDPGFRWASQSLINSRDHFITVDKCNAVCTEEGLIASYQCISFETITVQREEVWLLLLPQKPNAGGCIIVTFDNTELRDANDEYTCNGLLVYDDFETSGDDSVAIAVFFHQPGVTGAQSKEPLSTAT